MTDRMIIYALVSGLVGRELYAYFKGRDKAKIDESKPIHEVLFFPDREFPCSFVTQALGVSTRDTCHNPSCRKLHGREGEYPSSMIKFLRFLADAKESVDLCIYVFTQPDMAKILCDLHRAKVKIRVITDRTEDDAHGSQLNRLRLAGIEIKSNKPGTGALMHHKFVVIDGRLLLSGSFNWTSKAVVSNYEAVMATSDRNLVAPFAAKFNELWSQFYPHPIGNNRYNNNY